MKRTSLFLTLLMILAVVFAFASCGGNQPPEPTPGPTPGPSPELMTITGVTLEDGEFTYDGTEKKLEVKGTLPTGVTVAYTDNKATDAGTYNVKATLTGEGYNTLVLTATLKINKATITGVTLEDGEFTYDGTEKKLEVKGTLPTGVTVAYTDNKATDAGTYNVKATLTGEGYNTLVLTATLKINKATITGITAEAEQKVDGDGERHLPEYQGTLPTGVTVTYVVDEEEKPDGVSAIGTYEFTLKFSGKNYETLELPVTYKVKLNAINLANSVINSFGSAPDPWDFLPECFETEYHTVSAVPDYVDFTNVSDIPANAIGKQMNVVYGLFNKTSVALSYVNTVMNAMNGIKSLYTAYLDSDPDDYQSYTGTISGFTFTLELGADSYLIRASIGSILVEIYSNVSDSTYGAKVQLTETTVLKYTVSDEALLVAMDVLDSVSTQIEFARDEDGNSVGLLYEYITLGDKQVTATSAMIEVGEDYTVVIGTKGDFIPASVSRNCEIYDNDTGCLVGTEVREDLKGIVYNTYWFPIYMLEGIESIKKVDKMNGDNADTIYVNGITGDTLHTKLMGATYGKKVFSRRYDVEFKTVYAYQYNTDTEEYDEVKLEIPMIFIQEEVISDFEGDFEEKNKDVLGSDGVSLQVKVSDYAAITYAYTTLLPIYDLAKDAVTHQMITEYCKQ